MLLSVCSCVHLTERNTIEIYVWKTHSPFLFFEKVTLKTTSLENLPHISPIALFFIYFWVCLCMAPWPNEIRKIPKIWYTWMDGPPWRRMPAGLWWRDLQPRLRICLKWCCRRQWQTHSLFPGLSTITWQRSTRSDLHALDAAYPYCTDIHT